MSVYVGIGVSAGGLEALSVIVQGLPQDSGCVFIIAQHTSPDKPSALSKLLSIKSKLPVLEVNEECDFKPGHIYVIPASHNLIYKNNRLALKHDKSSSHHPIPSVDSLFRALSLYKREKAVAVILTGMGHDGSRGIVDIKKYHGITIAQLPSEAKHPSMPQSAIDTGMVDYQLSLKDIATHLHSIVSMKSSWSLSPDSPALREIANTLRNYKHLNIFKYKAEMINRRINKRILMLDLKTVDEYALYIKKNPGEINTLYQEILIHVTSFFRDKESFMKLKEELEKYLQDKPDGYNIRIWSIGCSSGEEAYTLAILIDMIQNELGKNIKPNIFATDIDDFALDKARKAIYTQDEVKGVPDFVLNGYFTIKDGNYKVHSFIKEHIIFAHHDILSDPPFIDQDLISLRNVLIYIEPKTQNEIFSLCYNSLKKTGFLFLGQWEATLIDIKYFKLLDNNARIYQKKIMNNPPKIPSNYFNKQKTLNKDLAKKTKNKIKLDNIKQIISTKVYEFFEPNFLVIDEDYSIIYKKGQLPFISMPDGFVSLNILKNINEALRFDLQTILDHALKEKTPQKTGFIEIKLENKKRVLVRIIVFLLEQKDRAINFILYFQYADIDEIEFLIDDSVKKDNTHICKSLDSKLQKAKEQYQSLQQQSILYKENMQLLNEELQSSNEELQSQAEELETSNEELKSQAEELETSNEELKSSNAELQRLNNELALSSQQNKDLQENLSLILNSTQEAITGLDLNGNHTFVNDAAVKMLGFSKDELIGKNGHALWHHTKADGTPYPFEECETHRALDKGIVRIDKDLYWTKDGTPLPVSVMQTPIIKNKTVVGAVLSFLDTTDLKKIAQQLHTQERIYKTIFNNINIGIVYIGLDNVLIDANPYASTLFGYSLNELRHLSTADITLAEDLDIELEMIQQLLSKKRKTYEITKRFITKSKKIITAEVTGVIIYDDDGKPLYILKTIKDITNRQLLLDRLKKSQKMLGDIINSIPIIVMIFNEDKEIVMINNEFEKSTEFTKKDITTLTALASTMYPTKQLQQDACNFCMSVFKSKTPISKQQKIITKHGVNKTLISSLTKLQIKDENNKQLAVLTGVDITDRLKNEEIMISQSRQAAMGDMLSMIAHQWRQPLSVISMSANNLHAMLDLQGKVEPDSLRDFIKTIDNQTQYLSKTVDDFREFFKPDKQKEIVSLDTILSKLNQLVDTALQDNNITITMPKQSDIKIKTFQNELIQVLLNIVNNAKDAIKENKPAKRDISITTKTADGKVIISICDSGGGIDKNVINKLTEPYTTTKGKNGTGLGLYMSNIIVTKHLDGELRWENKNNGACFDIELNQEI